MSNSSGYDELIPLQRDVPVEEPQIDWTEFYPPRLSDAFIEKTLEHWADKASAEKKRFSLEIGEFIQSNIPEDERFKLFKSYAPICVNDLYTDFSCFIEGFTPGEAYELALSGTVNPKDNWFSRDSAESAEFLDDFISPEDYVTLGECIYGKNLNRLNKEYPALKAQIDEFIIRQQETEGLALWNDPAKLDIKQLFNKLISSRASAALVIKSADIVKETIANRSVRNL